MVTFFLWCSLAFIIRRCVFFVLFRRVIPARVAVRLGIIRLIIAAAVVIVGGYCWAGYGFHLSFWFGHRWRRHVRDLVKGRPVLITQARIVLKNKLKIIIVRKLYKTYCIKVCIVMVRTLT